MTERWPERLNVAEALLRGAPAQRTALRGRSQEERYDLSYGELAASVRRFAAALSSAGVREEQRVLIALPDVPELVIAFLGSIWAGAVPVLVNPTLRADDYAFFLGDTRAQLVVAFGAARSMRDAMAAGRADCWTVGPARSGRFWEALGSAGEMNDPYPSHRDDSAFWLYSSGTTGRPKGTVHRQRDILHSVETYGRQVIAIERDDVVYSTSRMFFAYGLGASLYFPLAAGAAAVLSPEPFDPARTWRILAEEKPTLFFAVPAVYRALLDHGDARREAIDSARLCISAGEALPESIFTEWSSRLGREILDGIGSTEALHIYLSNRPGSCRPGSLGSPVPGYEVRIVDERGIDVAPGEPGTMLVRGESLAAGYWHRREATERAFLGEWYVTGDQAVGDADGTYRVLGRVDDMLKISGQWVAPSEVEEVIRGVAGVADCAVVGVPDAYGLTELVACVIVVADADPVEPVLAGCATSLPRYKRPKRVVVLKEMPRTPTGKLQRFRLREILAAKA